MDCSRRRLASVIAFALIGVLPGCATPRAQPAPSSPQQPAPAVPPITIDSTEEQIRQAVGTARMGRKLNELLQRANPLPVPLSVGEYGATTAVPRILGVLDRHDVPATFFIPAMSVMLHPDMLSSILEKHRHEVGVHGWIHEFWPGIGDAAKEQLMLTRTSTT